MSEKLKELMGKPVLAIDFDGTLATYKSGWQGWEKTDPPIDGAIEFLHKAKKHFQLVIYMPMRH